MIFVNHDDFEVKTCFFSFQNFVSQDANEIFSAIKIFLARRNWKVMTIVVFLYSYGIWVNSGLKRLELAVKDALHEWTNPISTNLPVFFVFFFMNKTSCRNVNMICFFFWLTNKVYGKMAKHTLNILRCWHHMFFKVCLAILQFMHERMKGVK